MDLPAPRRREAAQAAAVDVTSSERPDREELATSLERDRAARG